MCTLTSFAKLAMPQIEILGMVGLLAFVSTPDRHLGGRLCTWIVLQAWQSVPMNSWSKKKSNSSTSPKFESKARCFDQILRMERDRESWYSEAPWNYHSNTSKINEFEDPYKEIWQEHWTLRVLKFVGTDCSTGIKWTQLSCSESILGE